MVAASFRSLALIVLASLCFSSHAEAKRVALVIGNSSYTVGPLANPVNDAEAIAAALRRLRFDNVVLRRNLDSQSFKQALRDFGNEASDSDIAVVFFAGHGTENNGSNYLIPVDAKLARAADLDLEAIRLDSLLGQLEGVSKLRLVILDACRNSLFPLSGGKRSQTRGLARVEPDDNTLIAYAAKEGTTADDGAEHKHSPFTEALLRHIEKPGVEIDYVFRLTRDDVLQATSRQQIPHLYGTLGSQRVYFTGPTASPAPPQTTDQAMVVPPGPVTSSEEPKEICIKLTGSQAIRKTKRNVIRGAIGDDVVESDVTTKLVRENFARLWCITKLEIRYEEHATPPIKISMPFDAKPTVKTVRFPPNTAVKSIGSSRKVGDKYVVTMQNKASTPSSEVKSWTSTEESFEFSVDQGSCKLFSFNESQQHFMQVLRYENIGYYYEYTTEKHDMTCEISSLH